MFCSRCGSEITGKSKFCPSCGLDLMATTPVHAIATGVLQELDLVRESLAAEYEIIEELGRGGMASVWLALDLRHPGAVRRLKSSSAALTVTGAGPAAAPGITAPKRAAAVRLLLHGNLPGGDLSAISRIQPGPTRREL